MSITFRVEGNPKGKGRPRFSVKGRRVIVHTPEDTRQYENLIALKYKEAKGHVFEGPVIIKIFCSFPIPNGISKKKKLEMIGCGHPLKKPDVDNIAKVVMDALNGVAYKDDKQVIELSVMKCYSEYKPQIYVEVIGGGESNE